jgi:transposase
VEKRFRVSVVIVNKLLQQRRRTAQIEPRDRFFRRKTRLLPERGRELNVLWAKQLDLTLAQIKERLREACTIPAIHQVPAKLGIFY